jgi:hypothetical protein
MRITGRAKKVFLLVLMGAPLLVLAAVLLLIAQGTANPAMRAPPRGAGAGSTGGANAIGEYLAGNEPGTTGRPAQTPEPPPR